MIHDLVPRGDTYQTTEPIGHNITYPDGSVNVEVRKLSAVIDFRNTRQEHFNLLVPGQIVGISVDDNGNKSVLVIDGDMAVRLTPKSDRSGTMYTVGPWSDEQHSALLAQPLEIGADSDIAGGKVTKVSTWIGDGYGHTTPDTDKHNPLVVAAKITDERRRHNS